MTSREGMTWREGMMWKETDDVPGAERLRAVATGYRQPAYPAKHK